MRSLFFTYLVQALFVWLWSTGFIGAKYGQPYAEPFTLLLIRMLITLVLLAGLARLLKTRWPGWRGAGHLAVTGLLVHGCYLGGVYYAIQGGMPSGIVSLIVGLQPLVTAAAAVVFLREGVSGRQWLGLLLGLVGVTLVLMEKFTGDPGDTSGFPLWTLVWAFFSLAGISLGTVYQKRHGTQADLVAGEDFDLFHRVAAYLRARGSGRVRFLWDRVVYEDPRRYRKMGYPRTMWLWFRNFLSVLVRGRSVSKAWDPVR